VKNSNYLGSILNADNKINIEIAGKTAKGNKAYTPRESELFVNYLKSTVN
jgi:hypothetical protein